MSKAHSKNGTWGVLPAISVVCAVAFGSAAAAELPAGKGRETFESVCAACHELDIAVQMRQTRSGWTGIIKLMKDMGADATPAQFNEIIDYLSEHFGKETAGKETAGKDSSPGGKKAIQGSVIPAAEPENPPLRRALPWERNPLRIGQALYRDNCVVCHDVDAENSKKLGPSFYHLFQREQMPRAKTKPSRSYVSAKIRVGGTIMPAFGKKLTDGQINALIDYLSSK